MVRFQWCWSFGECGVVAPDKGPTYELNRTKLHTYAEQLFELELFDKTE